MGLFHKSIEKRMDAFSLGIDKVWADGFDYEEEIFNFCTRNESSMAKFFEFNTKSSEAMIDPEIPQLTKDMLVVQTAALFDLVNKTIPDFGDMVHKSKAPIEEARAFREVMIKDMQKMADYKKNAALAERTMTRFENTLTEYQKSHEIIGKRIVRVKTDFWEAEKYFNSLRN